MSQKYSPTTGDKIIMQSFAQALEEAVLKYQVDIVDFIKKTLTTEIFEDYLTDYTVFSQSGSCIAGKILQELQRKGIQVKQISDDMKPYVRAQSETAFWIGYLLLYWVFEEGITGEALLKYDFEEIYWSYEVLHTQELSYAIERIKEEYRLDALENCRYIRNTDCKTVECSQENFRTLMHG